jgi:outer membrane protein assembly factor BamA
VFLTALLVLAAKQAHAEEALAPAPATTNAPSRFRSSEDGWLDVSGFLEEKYGFLPVVMPITEPAVGYGAAGGLAFLNRPLGAVKDGFGRPNMTVVSGLGTENGTWGAVAGDMRHWFDDRVQTLASFIYASVNLDFHGIGDGALADHPLHYNLEPKGGTVQTKYRLGNSRFWAGLNYAVAATRVSFKAPAGTPGLPDFERDSNVGGFTPTFTFDSRDNIFTPTRGTYLDASFGIFSEALGGDDEFQRARIIGMQFFPLHPKLSLGFRTEGAATFGDTPFYLRPFVSLRGAPVMRYQGEEMAQIETELRWQFWRRFSLVGFLGGGVAWNDLERFDNTQTVVTGGTGFRYEIARKYGMHMGLDVAFGPENTAVYIQVGSAWARP